MKYYIVAILILIVAFIVLFHTKTLPEAWQQFSDNVDSDFRGYKILEQLCLDIGGRIAGTEKGKESEKFISNQLKSFGYEDIYLHPFEHITWERDKCTLIISDSAGNVISTIEALSLGLTPTKTNIKFPLVDLYSGTQEDYAIYPKDSLRNKIVLVDKKSPIGHYIVHRVDKVRLAQKMGVRGIIIFNQLYGEVISIGTAAFENNSEIPAITITRENGLYIKELLQKSIQLYAELNISNKEYNTISHNISVDIPGKEKPHEYVLLTAHFDAWDVGQGAVDNGADVAVILEIARLFKKLDFQPLRTIRFIFFNAEEFGLVGSKRYIQDHRELLNQIVYTVNLEMNILPNGINLLFDDRDREWFETLSENLSALGMQKKVIASPWLESDQCYFMLLGVPTITFSEKTDIFAQHKYHSSGDNIELIESDDLKTCVKTVGIVMQEIANNPGFEPWRLSEQEIKQKIRNSDLEKLLELRNIKIDR
jgi:Iap family predicted aminopeptidase